MSLDHAKPSTQHAIDVPARERATERDSKISHISVALGVEVGHVVSAKVVSAVHQDRVQRVIGRGPLVLLQELVQAQVLRELIPEKLSF